MSTPAITIGSTHIPRIGLGTYKITGPDAAGDIAAAIGIGYRHIDTARMYENEAEVGKGIRNSGVDRSEIFVTTKVWPSDFHDLLPAVEDSLRKLQMDRVDLLLLHWPSDPESNKTAVAQLNEVINKGYAKSVGVSNFTIAQLEEARKEAPIICDQVEYHPYLSQAKLLAYLRSYDMALTAYRPLALGKVTKDPVLMDIASKHHKTAGQVTLRWLVQQDDVAVIPKTTHRERMAENFNIFDFELTQQEMDAIFALNKDERLTNPSTAPDWD
ncbi:MAG: aldo/keto reductase [Bacteroidetes bacterium]|nr:aldo/keto reductase [Bacteroidota bacterium]MBS1686685.1 aldo/keto reductase [Bacteroidota bacterium]